MHGWIFTVHIHVYEHYLVLLLIHVFCVHVPYILYMPFPRKSNYMYMYILSLTEVGILKHGRMWDPSPKEILYEQLFTLGFYWDLSQILFRKMMSFFAMYLCTYIMIIYNETCHEQTPSMGSIKISLTKEVSLIQRLIIQ